MKQGFNKCFIYWIWLKLWKLVKFIYYICYKCSRGKGKEGEVEVSESSEKQFDFSHACFEFSLEFFRTGPFCRRRRCIRFAGLNWRNRLKKWSLIWPRVTSHPLWVWAKHTGLAGTFFFLLLLLPPLFLFLFLSFSLSLYFSFPLALLRLISCQNLHSIFSSFFSVSRSLFFFLSPSQSLAKEKRSKNVYITCTQTHIQMA